MVWCERGEDGAVSTQFDDPHLSAPNQLPFLVHPAPLLPAPMPALPLPPLARRGLVGQLPAALQALRPRQWTKNGLVLLAAIFSHRLLDVATMQRVALAFGAFSLAASAIYLVNDLADREADRLHPRKCLRPLASGRLSVPLAVLCVVLCLGGAAALTAVVVRSATGLHGDPFAHLGGSGVLFAGVVAAYVGLNLLYSSVLKHLVLWDVFAIAGGFVLRALAGAFAAAVVISPWFYLTAVFLSLVLALGKRRAELTRPRTPHVQRPALADGPAVDMLVDMLADTPAGVARRSLLEYTPQLLDQLITIAVTCVLLTYSLYTFEGVGASHQLMLTIPIVVFGVFRYLYLMYVKVEGEQPDELLLRDRQLLGAVILCVAMVASLLYGPQLLQGTSLP